MFLLWIVNGFVGVLIKLLGTCTWGSRGISDKMNSWSDTLITQFHRNVMKIKAVQCRKTNSWSGASLDPYTSRDQCIAHPEAWPMKRCTLRLVQAGISRPVRWCTPPSSVPDPCPPHRVCTSLMLPQRPFPNTEFTLPRNKTTRT